MNKFPKEAEPAKKDEIFCSSCGISEQGMQYSRVNIELGQSVSGEVYFMLKGHFCGSCIQAYWPFELKEERSLQWMPSGDSFNKRIQDEIPKRS